MHSRECLLVPRCINDNSSVEIHYQIMHIANIAQSSPTDGHIREHKKQHKKVPPALPNHTAGLQII